MVIRHLFVPNTLNERRSDSGLLQGQRKRSDMILVQKQQGNLDQTTFHYKEIKSVLVQETPHELRSDMVLVHIYRMNGDHA